ncbi:MAG: flagellar hook capping FlgD N-terminal domain-containing protein [Cycloclasticus sp.]|jgi:Flagellar hook capping protein
MPVDTIGSINSQVDTGNSNIDFNDYMKIFLAQLSNQNPLEPVDNKEFLTQMAAFTELQVSQQNSAKLDQVINVMATNQSIGLLGKNVEIANAGIIGEVTAISTNTGQPLLTVKSSDGQYYTRLSPSDISVVQE